MPKRALFSAGAILLVLLGLNIWLRPNNSATSLGVNRDGYKAAYQLLNELGFPVTRSYLSPRQTPRNQTLWLVLPDFLNPESRDAKGDARRFLRWVKAGGTGVVFGAPGSDWKRLDVKRQVSPVSGIAIVTGAFSPVPHRIDVRKLLHFKSGKGHGAVRLKVDGKPFALGYKLGKGRLVAIADGRFIRNANLGSADASVLVVDLARALGTPVFDEYCHGLTTPVSLVATILESRAMLPLIVALFAALLWVGEQRSWPRRTIDDEPEGPEPSIATFVESLGMLYSQAGDPGAVFRAYRSGFLHRLRRQLSAGGEIAEETLLERLAYDTSLSSETRQWLVDGAMPKNNSELVIAVRAIESYCGGTRS